MCAAPARRLSTHIVPCVLGSTAAAPPTGSRTADDAARGLLSDPGTPAGNPQPLSHSTAARRSKAAVAAATRDYVVKPRLEYRTVQGVNGPLVILEVRAARAPCAELMILCPRPPVRVFVAERAPSAVRRDRQPDPQRRHAALGPGAGGAGLQGRRSGLRGHVGHRQQGHVGRVLGQHPDDAGVGGHARPHLQRLGQADRQGARLPTAAAAAPCPPPVTPLGGTPSPPPHPTPPHTQL